MLSTLVRSNENRLPASQEEAPASIKRGRMSPSDGISLYQYQITEHTMQELNINELSEAWDIRYCRDGSIMYSLHNGIHQINPQTWEDHIIAEIDESSYYADDDMLYVYGENGTDGYALDFRSGKTVPFTYPIEEAVKIMGTDQSNIFVWDTTETFTMLPEWFMKKSDLLEGKREWYPIEIYQKAEFN